MDLPGPETKLRLVLDYLPCEACLAQPVADQELLCTICARVDRQIAVRVGTRTTILVERPSPPEAPIVIPPAPVAIAEGARDDVAKGEVPREISVTLAGEPTRAEPGSIEVVVEPLEMLAPLGLLPPPAPIVAPEPEAEPEEDFQFDDLVSFVPARDEFFDYKGAKPEPKLSATIVAEEPPPTFVNEPAPIPDDDYVFRPPPAEEQAPPAREEPAMADDIIPTEEVPVESPREEQERWAPPQRSEDPDAQWRQGPPDFLAEEAAQEEIVEAQVVQDEEVLEAELVEDEPAPPPPPPALAEEEIFEAELVEEDEPVLEMEVVPEEAEAPAPTGAGDLYRLRGFDPGAESALGKAGIREVAHLAGHDAGELAQRTGIAFDRILPWIQVADLVQDVGVPMDAANALVAAGVAGPRGLAESDPDEIVDRVSAFGGATLDARDVRRWKRRA